MSRQVRAECLDCGQTWTGDMEQVSEDVDDHDRFHDVEIQPLATDGGESWTRLTVRVRSDLLEAVDDAVERGEFPNRSEAVRTSVHERIVGVDRTAAFRLYYAAGVGNSSGRDRTLHVNPACPDLQNAASHGWCSLNNLPAGTICDRCAPNTTLDDLPGRRALADGGINMAPGTSSTALDDDIAGPVCRERGCERDRVAETRYCERHQDDEEDVPLVTDGGKDETITPADQLERAAVIVGGVSESEQLTEGQQSAAHHLGALVDDLASSVRWMHEEGPEGSLMTDGGHLIDPDAWYVLSGDRDAVVSGPHDDIDEAKAAAAAKGTDYLAVDGSALQRIRGDTTLLWENGEDDVRTVTDGGHPVGAGGPASPPPTFRADGHDPEAALRHAGVGDQDPTCTHGTEGCPGPDAPGDELPCFDCLLEGGEQS